jgi:hypothetical protein
MVWRLGLLLLAACGRIGFDPEGGAPDGAPGPWSTPVVVSELSSPSLDDDPTLTDDMLEIFFNRAASNYEIWTATRLSIDDPFGTPRIVTELGSPSEESTPEISGDGLTLYLSSTRSSSDDDIYIATRATRSSAWSTPVLVTELNSAAGDEGAMVDRAGTTVYFDSDRLGVDTVFTATRADPSSAWSSPVPLAELDTAGQEESPFLEASGLVIWLNVKNGVAFDLGVATRATPDGRFEPATLSELSSPDNEADAWLSPDGRVIYFASDRDGDYEIYRATR